MARAVSIRLSLLWGPTLSDGGGILSSTRMSGETGRGARLAPGGRVRRSATSTSTHMAITLGLAAVAGIDLDRFDLTHRRPLCPGRPDELLWTQGIVSCSVGTVVWVTSRGQV